MNRERLLQWLFKSVLLFVISVVLVAGFWFHQTFYQIGLYPLLLVGGFVTFLTMMMGYLVVSGRAFRKRPKGTVGLTFDEGERIAHRSATLLAFSPETASDLRPGTVVNAKYLHGSAVLARLAVRESYRKPLGDLTDDEVNALGYWDRASLHSAMEKRGAWNPNDVVVLARIRIMEDRA